jgi:hypothetical protein
LVKEGEYADAVRAFFEIEIEKVLEVQMICFNEFYLVFLRIQYKKIPVKYGGNDIEK